MKTMKKQYSSPNLMEEQFAANKYVAACDHGTQYGNYKFECNAGQTGHNYYIHDGYRYATINNHYFGPSLLFGHIYTPCNVTHESPTNAEYLTGYYLDDADTPNKESIEVIIWTAGGKDVHATKNLDRDSWVVDRS